MGRAPKIPGVRVRFHHSATASEIHGDGTTSKLVPWTTLRDLNGNGYKDIMVPDKGRGELGKPAHHTLIWLKKLFTPGFPGRMGSPPPCTPRVDP